MSKRKKKLSPVSIFIIGVTAMVALAVIWDLSTRRPAGGGGGGNQPAEGLSEMDLQQLRAAYDAIEIASTEALPSTIQAIEQRISYAQRMYKQAETPEDIQQSQRLLIGAMASHYTTLRNGKLSGAKTSGSKLATFLQEVLDREPSGNHSLATLVLIDLATHRILDGNSDAANREQLLALVDRIRQKHADGETIGLLAKTVDLMIQSEVDSAAVDPLIQHVAGRFSDHPDAEIRVWAGNLLDDGIFRKHGIFRLRSNLHNSFPAAAGQLAEAFPLLLKEPLSEQGLTRLAGICRELEVLDFYPEARTCFALLKDRVVGLADSPRVKELLHECDYGLVRVEVVGKSVDPVFVDVKGESRRFSDAGFANSGFLVAVFSSPEEALEVFGESFSGEILKSRNVTVLLLFPGLTNEQVRTGMTDMERPGIILVADPERTSELFQLVPVQVSPHFWSISRSKTILDGSVPPDHVGRVLESLMFSR